MKKKAPINILSFLTPKQYTFFVDGDITVRAFLEKADFHKFTVVPVLDEEGKYVNSISEGDVLRYIKNDANFDLGKAENSLISEVARHRPYAYAKVNVEFPELLRLLLAQNFVPLIDDRGVFIGIVKRSTVMEFLMKEGAFDLK
ncbi:MAG: CBS domain-containing protein [Bacilli bacterium]|nr:CBS domain-containing protein [Bacilli bacterium]